MAIVNSLAKTQVEAGMPPYLSAQLQLSLIHICTSNGTNQLAGLIFSLKLFAMPVLL